MRASIYARYSSDNQRDASIDDQVHNCRARIDAEGWTLVETYADHAISGASLLRAGYQAMLEDARAGRFDIVIAEALDRLSRDQEDVAALYKQLSFAGVKLITLAEGEISELHVGLKGTMNALFLKDLAQKTHRGLAGRVRSGKSGGGKAYGYDVVRELDETGEPIRGNQTINPTEASVVSRIFRDYINGKSPRAIAFALNKEGVPGPTGKGWTASTIIGNRKRGTGVLNNQLYIGKRIWNRLNYRRDPNTRKRVSQLNPKEDWIIVDVPELRIIEDETWLEVQALQEGRSRPTRPDKGPSPDWRHRRPKRLFSGLIKCASCGGGMTLISRVYYGCAANRNKGTCDNRLTLRLDRLEDAVLYGLQDRLLTPELTKIFVKEYTEEVNRIRAKASASHDEANRRRSSLETKIEHIVDSVAAGRASRALLDRLEKHEAELELIKTELTEPPPDPIRIHPNIAGYYVEKVNGLRECLVQEDTREEAAGIIRGLVDEIRLHPIEGALQIELKGDLATLIGFADQYDPKSKQPGSNGKPGCTKWLVAGAGFVQDPTISKFV
jgi:site-specific DNA recombinase